VLPYLTAMGNIISYFFPQPAPPSIEQVEKGVQDDKTTEETLEDAVAAEIEDAVVEETKAADLVVEEGIEPEIKSDEGFEVVEDVTLSEVNNIKSITEINSEIVGNKEENPGPAFTDDKEARLEEKAEKSPELEVDVETDELATVKNETVETVESSTPCGYALTSNSPPADVEVIGSIQDEVNGLAKVECETVVIEAKDEPNPPCIFAFTSNTPPAEDAAPEEVNNLVLVQEEAPIVDERSTPCLIGQSSNSPPATVEAEAENKDMITGSEEVWTPEAPVEAVPNPVNSSSVESDAIQSETLKGVSPVSTEQIDLKEDSADEESLNKPEEDFVANSEETVLPQVAAQQIPEQTKDTQEAVEAPTSPEVPAQNESELLVSEQGKVTSSDVEVIGSISDEISSNPSSNLGGLEISEAPKTMVKEDSPVEGKDASPDVGEVSKEVCGGVEGLKDVLTENNKVEDAPKEVTGGVAGLKEVLTESNKVEE